MSVKQMTPKQIRDDQRTIALTWPEGVPWQQADRVTALMGELKRRGEPLEAPEEETRSITGRSLTSLSEDELEASLRAISERLARDQNNEDLQKTFADVRFELRRRSKAQPAGEDAGRMLSSSYADEALPPRPALPPRELELPSDDEVLSRLPAPEERIVPRRPQPKPTAQPTNDNPRITDRVGLLLLEKVETLLEGNQFADAAMLIEAFAQLRDSLQRNPSSV